jgi:hypothetical protein
MRGLLLQLCRAPAHRRSSVRRLAVSFVYADLTTADDDATDVRGDAGRGASAVRIATLLQEVILSVRQHVIVDAGIGSDAVQLTASLPAVTTTWRPTVWSAREPRGAQSPVVSAACIMAPPNRMCTIVELNSPTVIHREVAVDQRKITHGCIYAVP